MDYSNPVDIQGKTHHTSTNFLTPDHIRHIEGRGLLNDWSRANCRSIGVQEASHWLSYTAKSAGILFEGEGLQIQFKPDKPWKGDEKEKKAPKYRSPLGDYDAFLAKHPTQKDYWSPENLKEIAYQVDGHPCVPITEGPFKGIAGCCNGLPTVALLGVSMGLTPKDSDPQGKRYLVESLEKLAKAGLGFIFAFDADAVTNDNVNWEQLKLAHQLKKFNVPIYSVTGLWDAGEDGETKGMDDYIQRHGADKFKSDILPKAQKIEAWEKQFKESQASSSKKKGCDTPSADSMGRVIAEDYRDRLAFSNENQTWYRYEAESPGVWTSETEEYVEALILGICEAKGLADFPASYLSNVLRFCRSRLIQRVWKERRDLLPFHNGALEINTGKLLPHSPGYKFTWCLPRKHDPEATDWSEIDKWLDFATSGNQQLRETLIAFAAATLTGTAAQFQKFLHLVGIGGSGKGTFQRLLVDLIGLENCHISTLDEWCSNRFEPAQAHRKQLLLFPDEDKGVRSLGKFKQVTGGDWLRAEEKNKKPFKYKFDGAVVVASNFPIFGSDNSSGMSRRTIAIPFNAVVARSSRCDLNAKFQPCLPAFTNYLLSLDPDWISTRLREVQDIPEISLQFWENQMRENSIAGFLNDKLIYDSTASTLVGDSKEKTDTLYGAYYAYCEAQGHRAQAVKNFSPNLMELATTVLGLPLKKEHTKVGNVILGLRLRDAFDDHLATYDYELRSRCQNAGEGSGEGSVKDSVKGQNAYAVSVVAPVKDKPLDSLEKIEKKFDIDGDPNEKTSADIVINPSPALEPLQREASNLSPDPSPNPSPDPSPVSEVLNPGDLVEDVGNGNRFRVVDSDGKTAQLETLNGQRLPRRSHSRNLKLIESAGKQLSLEIDLSPDGW